MHGPCLGGAPSATARRREPVQSPPDGHGSGSGGVGGLLSRPPLRRSRPTSAASLGRGPGSFSGRALVTMHAPPRRPAGGAETPASGQPSTDGRRSTIRFLSFDGRSMLDRLAFFWRLTTGQHLPRRPLGGDGEGACTPGRTPGLGGSVLAPRCRRGPRRLGCRVPLCLPQRRRRRCLCPRGQRRWGRQRAVTTPPMRSSWASAWPGHLALVQGGRNCEKSFD